MKGQILLLFQAETHTIIDTGKRSALTWPVQVRVRATVHSADLVKKIYILRMQIGDRLNFLTCIINCLIPTLETRCTMCNEHT